jgi:hypothetical protein
MALPEFMGRSKSGTGFTQPRGEGCRVVSGADRLGRTLGFLDLDPLLFLSSTS